MLRARAIGDACRKNINPYVISIDYPMCSSNCACDLGAFLLSFNSKFNSNYFLCCNTYKFKLSEGGKCNSISGCFFSRGRLQHLFRALQSFHCRKISVAYTDDNHRHGKGRSADNRLFSLVHISYNSIG